MCCCLSVLSQNKCNLQISVYEFKADGSSEEFPVKDAKITLVDKQTKKSLKISTNTDIPTFLDVFEKEYEATISKEGFQKTVETVIPNCSLSNDQNTISEIVFLWKGNSKQIHKPAFVKSAEFRQFKSDEKEPVNTGVAEKEPVNKEAVDTGAVLLVKPKYPPAAKAVKAAGAVNVQVTINELGYVISARAISGHPLLRAAAVEAAKKSKFRMTMLEEIPVKVTGIIVYNFVP